MLLDSGEALPCQFAYAQGKLAEVFDEFGVIAEKRVFGSAEKTVENGLGGQYVGLHGEELVEDGLAVDQAALANAVAQQGDADLLAKCLHGGLVNADGHFDTDEQEVIDLIGLDPAVQAFGFECGKRAFRENGCIFRPAGGQGGVGRPEFFRDLLACGDGHAE